ncbi:uncharacterized protein FRV6_07781 [Fusarium oxysporum]|uniref:Uncharacterized protein n=1 Tax=Fusarium oxysporum TaxID=5507 RepID=A0A2H3T4K0_FUSOX|nr:uncharacterized protein FRV6_07781 [Fusarium oxysporum]
MAERSKALCSGRQA